METLLHFGLSNALMATALALPAAVVSRFCRRPALAHGLWLLVVLKLFTPPLFSVPIFWLSPPALRATSAVDVPVQSAEPEDTDSAGARPSLLPDVDPQELCPAVGATSASPSPPRSGTAPTAATLTDLPWDWAAGLCWGTGSALWLASVSWRLCRFQRLLRGARKAPLEIQARVGVLAERLGLSRYPGVWFVPGRVSPMLWTWGGPARLLLPEALWKQLRSAQQDTLLAHELAHLRRRDHWVRWLELAAVAVYWWHPVVWWAQRELEESEEQCCDAWVVAVLPAAAEFYAEALLQTVVYLSQARAPVAVGASGAGRVHDVKRRLIMILDGTVPKALSPAGRWAVLVVAAVLLPLWPTWAQSQGSLPSDRFRPDPAAGSARQDPSIPARTIYRGEGSFLNGSVALLFRAEEQSPDDGQINEARAAVQDLTSALAQLRDRMESLSLRLQKAKSRLAQLEGRTEPKSPSAPTRFEPPRPVAQGNFMPPTPVAVPPVQAATQPPMIGRPAQEGVIPPRTGQVLSGPAGVIANPTMPQPVQPPSVTPAATPRNYSRNKGMAGPAVQGERRGGEDYDQRLRELELKLDRLLEEFKTFRQGQPSKRWDDRPQPEYPRQ